MFINGNFARGYLASFYSQPVDRHALEASKEAAREILVGYRAGAIHRKVAFEMLSFLLHSRKGPSNH